MLKWEPRYKGKQGFTKALVKTIDWYTNKKIEINLKTISIIIKMVKISNVKLISSIIESIQKVTKNKKANNLHEPTLSKLEEKYLKNV